jgi:hypothetical protein
MILAQAERRPRAAQEYAERVEAFSQHFLSFLSVWSQVVALH